MLGKTWGKKETGRAVSRGSKEEGTLALLSC